MYPCRLAGYGEGGKGDVTQVEKVDSPPNPQQAGPKIPSSLSVVHNSAEFGLFILEDNPTCFLLVYVTLWAGGRSHPPLSAIKGGPCFILYVFTALWPNACAPLFTDS